MGKKTGISRGVVGSNQKNPVWGKYGYFLEEHNLCSDPREKILI